MHGQASVLLRACVGLQLCPLPLSGSEVKTVQDFSNFFSYKTKIRNKGGLGRTWAIEHLRLILVLRKQTRTLLVKVFEPHRRWPWTCWEWSF